MKSSKNRDLSSFESLHLLYVAVLSGHRIDSLTEDPDNNAIFRSLDDVFDGPSINNSVVAGSLHCTWLQAAIWLSIFPNDPPIVVCKPSSPSHALVREDQP